MEEIIKNTYQIIVESYSLLKDLKITTTLDNYPLEVPFDSKMKSIPPYAQLSIKCSDKLDSKKPYLYSIRLFQNMTEYFGDYIYEGTNEDTVKFFNAINVVFNNTSSIVFNFLHELGHILTYENFKADTGSYDDQNRLTRISDDLLKMVFKEKSKTDYCKMMNKYSYNELYAEKFAYSQFPVVWKQLNVQ